MKKITGAFSSSLTGVGSSIPSAQPVALLVASPKLPEDIVAHFSGDQKRSLSVGEGSSFFLLFNLSWLWSSDFGP